MRKCGATFRYIGSDEDVFCGLEEGHMCADGVTPSAHAEYREEKCKVCNCSRSSCRVSRLKCCQDCTHP